MSLTNDHFGPVFTSWTTVNMALNPYFIKQCVSYLSLVLITLNLHQLKQCSTSVTQLPLDRSFLEFHATYLYES